MSNITLTPNMNLPVPVVGQEPGPDYASDVNSSLTLIDSHDHTPGSGVLITPLAININSALSFNNNFLDNVAGVNFEAQTNTPAVGTIYERGLDLYFVDGLGNDVRITQDGGVAGTPGSISGLVPPASASYIPGNSTFVWQSNTNIAANMDMGSVLLRNLSPNSTFALTLAPPPGLSSNFQITLPTLPAVQSFMTINASGLIQAPAAFNQGLVNSNLANETITAAKIAPQTIDGSRMVNHTVTFLQLDQAIFENQEITYTVIPATYAVRAATTTNGSLSTAFHNGSVIDGITLATGNIILLKNQTLASENGVYVVQVAGVPVRDVNYDTVAELNFAGVIITSGTVNAGRSYYQNTYLTSLLDLQVWSESQSFQFTVPATGVKSIEYEMCGGGGGGGGGAAGECGGAGGGGGGVKVNGIMTVAANNILSITVGAGGFGGAGMAVAATSASVGTNGSPSIIYDVTTSNTVVAVGGGGGGGGVTKFEPTPLIASGNGAIGAGGLGGGTDPVNNYAGGAGGGGSNGNGGPGGIVGQTSTAQAATTATIGYGGGGGGGGALTNGTIGTQNGAAGALNNFGFVGTVPYAGGTGGVGANQQGGAGGGGAGPYGAGANAPSASNPGNVGNNAAAGTGAGGSGAGASVTGTSGKAGGHGGSGRVIIRYYGS